MLHRIRLGRKLALAACGLILLAVAAVSVIFYVGYVSDSEPAPASGSSGESFGGSPLLGYRLYTGPALLELEIVVSDVIARAKLVSVAEGVEELSDWPADGETTYVKVLKFTFEALEYLKGSGESQFVAVVYDLDKLHETKEAAAASGPDFFNARDTRWDDREAIVFLITVDLPVPEGWRRQPMPKQEGHYWFGLLRSVGEIDKFTISSGHSRRWLPAASAGELANAAPYSASANVSADSVSDGGEQRFLLEAPTGGAGAQGAWQAQGAQSGSPETQTITLSGLKALIAALQAEIDAGDGSDEYWSCVFHKYRWEGIVRYVKENSFSEGGYFHKRYDHALDSGLPVGTKVHDYERAHRLVESFGEALPSKYAGMFELWGGDEDLFRVEYPGDVFLARPLPAGEYRYYFNTTPTIYIICDGEPEEERKRFEHFVSVAAPAGTVHEAFFDPVNLAASTPGFSAIASSTGVLSPADFTIGGANTTITGLKWQSGSVALTLSPYVSLSGHILDFIALDGSIALTLSGDSATEDTAAGTLTWAVTSQPWSAGDELMLRIRRIPPPTPTPVPPIYLSPDPSTVDIRVKGDEWHRFTLHTNEDVLVVANPSGSAPTVFMVSYDTGDSNWCPARQSVILSRRNGDHIYLAGCATGEATLEFRQKGTGKVLLSYTFSVGATAVPTATPTALPSPTPVPTATPTALPSPTPTPTATPTASPSPTPTPAPAATATSTPALQTAHFYPTSAELRSGGLAPLGCEEAWECVDESVSDGSATFVTLLFGGGVRFGFTVNDGDVPGTVADVRFEVAIAANSVEIDPGSYGFVVYAGSDEAASVRGEQAVGTDYVEVEVSSDAITDALSSGLAEAAIEVEGPTNTFMRVTWVRMVVEYTPTGSEQ